MCEVLQDFLTPLLQPLSWREAFDQLLHKTRQQLVFDHVVVYAADDREDAVIFARAMGRARAAEADVDWGMATAQEVLREGQPVLHNRLPAATAPREQQPLFMGLPVGGADDLLAALIFVRFGGPAFSEEDLCRGRTLAALLQLLLERAQARQRIQGLERLERQMRLQEDFVSTISHELRTPLGFIKGFTTSLLREDANWDAETQREFLQIIDEEVDRLAELLEKMLESARLQSDTLEMNFQWMRLDVLIRDVTVREMTRDRDLEVILEMEPAPPIRGDSVRLSQVFENLFSNARKYAPGSPVLIKSWHDAQWLYVTFSDRGPGIPAEHQPFVFERFYRVPGQRGIKGTGLGLFICREIILAHGGQLKVDTPPEGGTRFTIQLPLETTPLTGKEKQDD